MQRKTGLLRWKDEGIGGLVWAVAVVKNLKLPFTRIRSLDLSHPEVTREAFERER